MGMYTEFHFNALLKPDVPKKVIDVLKCMVGDPSCPHERTEGIDTRDLPDHALFGETRWRWMLTGNSYYFDMVPSSILKWDSISNAYYLSTRSNFKNYDNEISLFIDWIKPYLDKDDGEFLGFSRYETTETPTLIYM